LAISFFLSRAMEKLVVLPRKLTFRTKGPSSLSFTIMNPSEKDATFRILIGRGNLAE
jgi:hypothetical protein